MAILIGVKVGQRHSPSAVCVAENTKRTILQSRQEYHFLVRYLERIPAGTGFPAVADRVGEILRSVRQESPDNVRLFIDTTGLGEPILGLFKDRAEGARVFAVYFNHGERRDVELHEVKLGKAYLVARLQMLLQSGRLHLPRTKEARILTEDLLDFEVQMDGDANERSGAFAVGHDDDLVTALGLAVQDDGAPTSGFMRAW